MPELDPNASLGEAVGEGLLGGLQRGVQSREMFREAAERVDVRRRGKRKLSELGIDLTNLGFPKEASNQIDVEDIKGLAPIITQLGQIHRAGRLAGSRGGIPEDLRLLLRAQASVEQEERLLGVPYTDEEFSAKTVDGFNTLKAVLESMRKGGKAQAPPKAPVPKTTVETVRERLRKAAGQ